MEGKPQAVREAKAAVEAQAPNLEPRVMVVAVVAPVVVLVEEEKALAADNQASAAKMMTTTMTTTTSVGRRTVVASPQDSPWPMKNTTQARHSVPSS